ncbi:hypothetical protein BGE01nite_03330 [Brevifollis gellanilyticus]|uniref:Uncharacterized protein n=1 Tax=Brevifollis gellanilyticus TaxID=748831 RepID=A0A512M2T2_9BACT|nr:hypothetical protein BGE01nite_03330 [Brevifollis gellanilyticus]
MVHPGVITDRREPEVPVPIILKHRARMATEAEPALPSFIQINVRFEKRLGRRRHPIPGIVSRIGRP